MKLTVKECVEMYNAISKMKDAGITVKGLKNIDLAMNKSKLDPIFEGYKVISEAPIEYSKYVEEIEDLKMKSMDSKGNLLDPKKTATDFSILKEKHKVAIAKYEEWKKILEDTLKEKKDIKLIMLDREDFTFTDGNSAATDVIYGLLPCIKSNE